MASSDSAARVASPPWGSAASYASAGLICAFVVHAAATLTIPRLAPERWSRMEPAHALSIPKHFVEAIPAFVTPLLISADVYHFTLAALIDPASSQHIQATPSAWCANSFNAAIMAYDSALLLLFARRMIYSEGWKLYVQMWVHHFVGVFVSFVGLYYDQAMLTVVWLCFSEAPTGMLMARKIMIKLGAARRLTTRVTVFWLALFFFTRILPAPLLLWCHAAGRMSQPVVRNTGLPTPSWVIFFHALTAPVMCALNSYWFYTACKYLLGHCFQPAARSKGGRKSAAVGRDGRTGNKGHLSPACPPM